MCPALLKKQVFYFAESFALYVPTYVLCVYFTLLNHLHTCTHVLCVCVCVCDTVDICPSLSVVKFVNIRSRLTLS